MPSSRRDARARLHARDASEGGRSRAPTSRAATTVLVFYPFAFSPVCTDQLSVYNEVLDEFAERGATLYGVSCDAVWSQEAFKRAARHRRSSSCRTSSPRAPPAAPSACCTRAASRSGRWCMIGPDGVVRWSYEAASPGELPGANLIFDALDRACRAERPALRPAAAARPRRPRPRAGRRAADRRVRRLRVPVLRRAGAAPGDVPLRVCFRHFPVRGGHPRALPAACAAEAAARCRARSGRCTTRCSPIRGGWRIRTCGRAPSGSGSTSRASTPTGATTPSPRASRTTSAAASGRACRRLRRCSLPACCYAGRPDGATLERIANLAA